MSSWVWSLCVTTLARYPMSVRSSSCAIIVMTCWKSSLFGPCMDSFKVIIVSKACENNDGKWCFKIPCPQLWSTAISDHLDHKCVWLSSPRRHDTLAMHLWIEGIPVRRYQVVVEFYSLKNWFSHSVLWFLLVPRPLHEQCLVEWDHIYYSKTTVLFRFAYYFLVGQTHLGYMFTHSVP